MTTNLLLSLYIGARGRSIPSPATQEESFLWLFSQWWFWLAFIISAGLSWYLFHRRQYRMIGGKLHVRHGRLRPWVDVEAHLKIDHKEDL